MTSRDHSRKVASMSENVPYDDSMTSASAHERRPDRLMRGAVGSSHHHRQDFDQSAEYARHGASHSSRHRSGAAAAQHQYDYAQPTPDHVDGNSGAAYYRLSNQPNNSGGNNPHLDPSSAAAAAAGGAGLKPHKTRKQRLESISRNDSLSSDPSDCVRPPPPKPHKHKHKRATTATTTMTSSTTQKPNSLSSSDDELQTPSECSSCDEQEIESESISEKGE